MKLIKSLMLISVISLFSFSSFAEDEECTDPTESIVGSKCGCDGKINDYVRRPGQKSLCLPKCRDGFERWGLSCRTSCPTGYVRNNSGYCRKDETPKEPENKISCPANTEEVLGQCLRRCSASQERVGEKCLTACNTNQVRDHLGNCRVNNAEVCSSSQEEVNGQCVRKCSISQERVDGKCVRKCNPTQERYEGKCTSKCRTNYKRSRDGICTFCKS